MITKDIFFIILILIVLAAAAKALLSLFKKQKYPYAKKLLLTKTEYRFYKILKVKCDQKGILICPKVRMEDFLYVTARENVGKYRGYIKSRHIDFILCDENLYMLAGLELDDPSHHTASAKAVDQFKNNVFKSIKVPLYRIATEPELYEKRITEMLKEICRVKIHNL